MLPLKRILYCLIYMDNLLNYFVIIIMLQISINLNILSNVWKITSSFTFLRFLKISMIEPNLCCYGIITFRCLGVQLELVSSVCVTAYDLWTSHRTFEIFTKLVTVLVGLLRLEKGIKYLSPFLFMNGVLRWFFLFFIRTKSFHYS